VTMDGRPLILVDWDGVINVLTSSKARSRLCFREHWRQTWIERPFLRAFWNPRVVPWLLHLAEDTGAELAWGSKWEEEAAYRYGPLIGLPVLPYSPANAVPSKAHGVVPWTAGRPFVWFDDEAHETAPAAELCGDQPHLVILTDERYGLEREHIDEAREWLLALPQETYAKQEDR
jgi:hypothetical protein